MYGLPALFFIVLTCFTPSFSDDTKAFLIALLVLAAAGLIALSLSAETGPLGDDQHRAVRRHRGLLERLARRLWSSMDG
jgi:hypothetical protein